jgi:hypothetical protein
MTGERERRSSDSVHRGPPSGPSKANQFTRFCYMQPACKPLTSLCSPRKDRFAKPLYWLIPVPRVRIPPSPPASLNRRETAPPFAAKYAKMPVFRNISSAKRTGENGLPGIEWRQSAGPAPPSAGVAVVPASGRKKLLINAHYTHRAAGICRSLAVMGCFRLSTNSSRRAC